MLPNQYELLIRKLVYIRLILALLVSTKHGSKQGNISYHGGTIIKSLMFYLCPHDTLFRQLEFSFQPKLAY
jgi:hypothetical protein